MILHPDRYATGASPIKNGVVVHDSEGSEGTLPWGQTASAQLISMLAAPGDRFTTSGRRYGSGYGAVAREDGTFSSVADANVGPYHCGAGINPNMWSICIPGRASQTRVQWLSDISRFYIKGVARYIVDRWEHDGRIWPLEFATGAQLKAARCDLPAHPVGYTSHAQVTISKLTATDHTDPGVSFPWDVLALDIAALVHPSNPQPPPHPMEDDMPDRLYKKVNKAAVWKGDGFSRTHVATEAQLAELVASQKYGALIPLDETADLNAVVGAIVVGANPGDV